MPIDVNQGFNDSKEKLKSFKSFNAAKDSINNAKDKANDLYQQNLQKTQTALNKVNKKVDNAEQKINEAKNKVKSTFDELFELFGSSRGAGSATNNYLTKKFSRIVQEIKPKIFEIFTQEVITSLGCSEEQTYGPQSLYIKVSSIDLFKMLVTDPNSITGKVMYERDVLDNFSVNLSPRPTNKLLYDLISHQGQSMNDLYGTKYKGVSGNDLFDITYVTNDNNNNQGSFFKIDLVNRIPNTPNRIKDFIIDYYKTVDMIDFNSFVAKLIDAITNIVSVEVGYGTAQLDDKSKFGLIVQRVLGLCFDNDEEISISGLAKTPEVDNIDESFFELSDVDLRNIEQETQLTRSGFVEFESCDNIRLPITDTQYALEIMSNVDGSNIGQSINNILDSLVNDPRWQLQIPFPNSVKLSINTDIIKTFPRAVIGALLSPKILLGFILMLKSLGVMFDDTITGIQNFFKQNKKLMIGLVSRIGEIFLKALFNEIAKDVLALAKSIIKDIANERAQTVLSAINNLVGLAVAIATAIQDFRKCRSLIQTLLQLFNLRLPTSAQIIPTPILALADVLPGASANRAWMNYIQNLQRVGINTGPYSNGSPNLGLIADFCLISGMYQERDENGKVEVFIPPLATGVFVTQPARASGKYF
jgi:hypothetical protein